MALSHVLARIARHLPGEIGARSAFVADRAALDRGNVPTSLAATIDRLLRRADSAYDAHDVDAAVDPLHKALLLAYHVAVREEPTQFLPRLRQSSAFQRVATDSSATRTRSRREDLTNPRVLIVAQRSFSFIEPVAESLRAHGIDVEMQELDGIVPASHLELEGLLRARLRGERFPIPAELAEAAERADVLFVEWGHHVLTWASLVDWPEHLRIVARLHRFEAFTVFPHLTDFSRIDRLLFVADHVRQLVLSVIPDLADRTDIALVHNLLELERFHSAPQSQRPPRVLLQVVWDRPVKDVNYALAVLHALREHDPTWVLKLAGRASEWSSAQISQKDRDSGAVEELGHRTDMPEVFRKASFIISGSLHEGTQESVAQGAAAGCVPVVRDWPRAKPYGGAASVYPSHWVVESPQDAARRILECSIDAETMATASGDAENWARHHRDPETVIGGYKDAIMRWGF